MPLPVGPASEGVGLRRRNGGAQNNLDLPIMRPYALAKSPGLIVRSRAWRALAIVAQQARQCRRGYGTDIGAKGNGCGSRVHADEGSHHLVLGDDDWSREASLAMKESTRRLRLCPPNSSRYRPAGYHQSRGHLYRWHVRLERNPTCVPFSKYPHTNSAHKRATDE